MRGPGFKQTVRFGDNGPSRTARGRGRVCVNKIFHHLPVNGFRTIEKRGSWDLQCTLKESPPGVWACVEVARSSFLGIWVGMSKSGKRCYLVYGNGRDSGGCTRVNLGPA